MAYVKFGNYQHEDYEVELSVDVSPMLNEALVPYQMVHRWTLKGLLLANTGLSAVDAHKNLTAKINALKEAYSQPASSVGFYLDGTKTAHVIEGALGGVRVIAGPSFQEGNGGEYSTYVHYTIGLEGIVPVSPNKIDQLVAFSESISFQGTTGPLFRYIQTITGSPQKQIVAQRSTMTATQSGNAVGYGGYPLAPSPLWPSDEHLEGRGIDKRSPKRIGMIGQASFVEYELSWNYSFESSVPMSANPNRFTIV